MYINNYENTGIVLSARFDSDIITLAESASFFRFFSEAFDISIKHFSPSSLEGEGRQPIISSVVVEAGSIKAIIEILKSREFQIGVASSLAAAIIWSVATFPWGHEIEVSSNIQKNQTVYRIPIDLQISAMVETMNKSGKPWSIEIAARDPSYKQELTVLMKGNQPQLESER